MENTFNNRIYFNNLINLEAKYSHLESTFDTHDDWVNFINDRMGDY